MTASIGFRAPSRREFLREFLAVAADDPGGSDPRFSDSGRPPARHPAAIPDDLHGQLAAWARDWRPDPELIDSFIGRFLTEPKPSVWFDSRPLPASATLVRQAGQRGLRLDRRTRMLYRKGRVFVNGEAFDFGQPMLTAMKRLADQRRLEPADCVVALGDGPFAEAVRAWISHGWAEIG